MRILHHPRTRKAFDVLVRLENSTELRLDQGYPLAQKKTISKPQNVPSMRNHQQHI